MPTLPESRRARAELMLRAAQSEVTDDNPCPNLLVQYAWDRAVSRVSSSTSTAMDNRDLRAVRARHWPRILLALRQGQERISKSRGERLLVDDSNTASRCLAEQQITDLQACREYLATELHKGTEDGVIVPSSSVVLENSPPSQAADRGDEDDEDAAESRSSTSATDEEEQGTTVADDTLDIDDNANDTRKTTTFSCHVTSIGPHNISLPGVPIATVACATYHTLLLSTTGTVYAMGHGCALGTGDSLPRPRPVPICHGMMAIAAAESHSLTVSTTGAVYAFGANGFGQIGRTMANTSTAGTVPQRVLDLPSTVQSVAAGARHSVALTTDGHLYSWGDNRSGQLGHSSNKNSKCPIRPIPHAATFTHIAAASVTTVALTDRGIVYGWGHGTVVPLKVVGLGDSPVVQVACGPYHTVAVTASGEVYTWGCWHAVGRRTVTPVPQRLRRLGPVVDVACAAHATVVVTATGRVYAVGESSSSDRDATTEWRHEPQPLPGIVRAVGVSVGAPDCTAVVVATTQPAVPARRGRTLAERAARVVMEQVEVRNVLSVMIAAERVQSESLVQFCREFVRRNMDLVLQYNLQKNSGELLDVYLTEQLREAEPETRTSMLEKVVLAGSRGAELCSLEEWIQACNQLLETDETIAKRCHDYLFEEQEAHHRQRRSNSITTDPTEGRTRSESIHCSERCDELLSSLDMASIDGAKETLAKLNKEVRAIRKRLGQIERLIGSVSEPSEMNLEQQRKADRKPLLESDLERLLPAIELMEDVIREFVRDNRSEVEDEIDSLAPPLETAPEAQLVDSQPPTDAATITEKPKEAKSEPMGDRTETTQQSYRCATCQIVCPDKRSLELHMNGRKHKNRMAQAAEEEQKIAATAIQQEQQRLALLQPTEKVSPRCLPLHHGSETKRTARPKFKLPPPPHPVGEMEDMSAASSPNLKQPARKKAPWSSSAPITTLRSPVSTSKKSLQQIMVEEAANGRKQSQNHSPIVAMTTRAPQQSQNALSKKQAPTRKAWEGTSLGDFLPPPRVSPVVTNNKPTTVWAPAALTPQPVSFREIQKEENNFQADPSYAKASGTWFIERKEKADSLDCIQKREAAEQEHQRLVEEQIQIEEQIYEQLRREKELASVKSKTKRKKTNRKKPNDKTKKQGGKRAPAKACTENTASK